MEWNLVNLWGGVLTALLLLPNLFYARRLPVGKPVPKALAAAEQVGRYGCIALMILPLGVGEFGFAGVTGMLVYGLGNGLLLATYWGIWPFYAKKPSAEKALALAILPGLVFLTSGLTLCHSLLTAAALLFLIAHTAVTLLQG